MRARARAGVCVCAKVTYMCVVRPCVPMQNKFRGRPQKLAARRSHTRTWDLASPLLFPPWPLASFRNKIQQQAMGSLFSDAAKSTYYASCKFCTHSLKLQNIFATQNKFHRNANLLILSFTPTLLAKDNNLVWRHSDSRGSNVSVKCANSFHVIRGLNNATW